MRNNPILSIVIPCYNAEKYVERTLISLINQTVKNIELIIVDDGSEDNTIEIVKKTLSGSDIKARIIEKCNTGVSGTRNRGLDISSGKYVYFLDSDDYIDDNMIELMINKAEEFDADVTFCGYDYVTENGIHYKRYDDNFRYIDDYIDGITALEKIINNKIHIWTGSVIYNKSFLDKHGLKYYEGCNYGEDFEFICKALCKSKRVTCVKGILAHYLQRSSSLVHNFNISNFKSLGAMNRLKWYVSKNCSDDEIIKAFNDNFNREALVIYNRYITNAKPSEKMDNIFKIMNSKYRKRLKAYKLKNLSKERVKRYILVNLYVFNLKIYTSFMKKKHHI